MTTENEHTVQERHRQRAEEQLKAPTARAVAQAQEQGDVLSLIVLDIDEFRQINDTYGHDTGDQILAELPQVIARHISQPVIRWGGEEYAILCPGKTPDEAVALAERIRSAIASHDFIKAGRVTVSLGVAAHQRGESPMDVIERAIVATYKAKTEGRNRVVVAG